ncbi:MAG: divergent polysaccharide deacetylase family protein [Campylobacterota bacterium]
MLFAVVILAIVTLVGFISGWLGYEIGNTSVAPQAKEQVKGELQDANKEIQQLRSQLKSYEKAKKLAAQKKEDVVVNFLTEAGDYGMDESVSPPRPEAKKDRPDKPLVAIVIDDVAYSHQLERIESLPIKVTPSIFPPAVDFRTTPQLAKGSKHYMVHLPMEAKSHPKYALPDTLTTDYTQTQLDRRIQKIRRWFPNAAFINNHTGSAYTEDDAAMERLYKSLRQNGFTFVDSRTTSQTKVPKLSEKHGQAYIYRDVFLDNKLKEDYIMGQIKKTVSIAKEHGSAMAIGHPHAVTLQTLAKANGEFDGVDVVYIDEFAQKAY